jgi:glycosyltransferase involved in cell wall biosynthesis
MGDVKVSVIIPVYNCEKYLKQCLDSVTGQTLKEIEIICVDDGSTDTSLQILKQFENGDSRIKVIQQKNAGAGAARNNGLSVAKGEYLSFLDSDDFFEPDMLEKAYNQAKHGSAQVVVFGSDQYYEETDEFKSVSWTLRKAALPPYRPMYFRTFTDNVFKVFVGWAWDKLFERKFVQEHELKFQEQRTSNDLLFVFSAVVLADRIEIVDEALAHQRRNTSTSLSNTREKSWKCFYYALTELKNTLIKNNLYYELEQDYINYALHFSLWNYETIVGDKKVEMLHKLKDEWLDELGISGKTEEYFYNKKEYKKYLDLGNE